MKPFVTLISTKLSPAFVSPMLRHQNFYRFTTTKLEKELNHDPSKPVQMSDKNFMDNNKVGNEDIDMRDPTLKPQGTDGSQKIMKDWNQDASNSSNQGSSVDNKDASKDTQQPNIKLDMKSDIKNSMGSKF